jgi:predicted alpha-1,6-mannanase (GH76 family)
VVFRKLGLSQGGPAEVTFSKVLVMSVSYHQVADFMEDRVIKGAIPSEAKYSYISGYLIGAVTTAMAVMTPEERAKFFPTIQVEDED